MPQITKGQKAEISHIIGSRAFWAQLSGLAEAAWPHWLTSLPSRCSKLSATVLWERIDRLEKSNIRVTALAGQTVPVDLWPRDRLRLINRSWRRPSRAQVNGACEESIWTSKGPCIEFYWPYSPCTELKHTPHTHSQASHLKASA